MEKLSADIQQYSKSSLIWLVLQAIVATVLIIVSLTNLFVVSAESLLFFIALGLLLAIASTRFVIELPGTNCHISLVEIVTFLAILSLSPSHAIILTLIDVFLASHRATSRSSLIIFNISNHTLSVFAAAKTYDYVRTFLSESFNLPNTNERMLIFAVPLILMAIAYYVVNAGDVALMFYFRHKTSFRKTISETLPWELVTLIATATAVGVVEYTYSNFGIVTMMVTMFLVAPVPVIIYYAFKTYKSSLIEKEYHYKEVTSIYDSILEMLAMAIDAKDDVTHDHIQRVKLFARRMGENIGLSVLEIEALKAGALLHDIGKIGVPAYILNKPGKLTEHEFEQMKMHTIIGADMLSNVDFRYPVVPIVRHHHERWDGRGYPDGLKGEAIPITARILTLVDTYDALRSDRPYHKAMSREDALTYLKQNAGSMYDPSLVEIFLNRVDELEMEAASFVASQTERRAEQKSAALTNAKPANGLAQEVKIDRAAAALHSIAETNQRVSALYELSRTLSSVLSVEDTVAILANRLSKMIPFTTCAIALFDATRSEYEIVHVIGRNADRLSKKRQPAEAGITGWVITNQKPMYNTNPLLDFGYLDAHEANKYKGVMVFPLCKNNDALGAIAIYSMEIESYSSEFIQLMDSISQPASDAVFNALMFEQAQKAASIDSQTGLANTRGLAAQFEQARVRCQQFNTPMSLLFVSLNNFEEVTTGALASTNHPLVNLGKLIKQQLMENEVVAKYWDNALIALLPHRSRKESAEICQKIEKVVQSADHLNLSVSIGSATTSSGNPESFEEMLQAAQMDCIANRTSFDFLTARLGNMMHTGDLN
ncbi:MAG: HD domain-containing phosphohydrolase [Acidobacteriota bacterium]